MFVEAFHNTLKQVYMQGRVNRRVDKCLHVLLQLAQDKAFERLIKLEKGKTTSRLSVIEARHRASLDLSTNIVTAKGSCIWAVDSGDTMYTVQQEQERCTQDCALECTQCNICLHMYSCTCYVNVFSPSLMNYEGASLSAPHWLASQQLRSTSQLQSLC
jgi:hypothetical protein